MKNCQKIQRELSAYLDGELAPSLRAEVEAHLASCADCQQELLEIKNLSMGLAALPNLKPAPRFLTEVRRKIVRGEKPEPLTWQDYAFRPLWLKIPLEVAALVVIAGFLMKEGHLLPTRDNYSEYRHRSIFSSETPAEVAKTAAADRSAAAETLQETPAAPAAEAVRLPAREVLEKEEKAVSTAETPGPAIVEDKKQSLDRLATSTVPAGGGDSSSTFGAKSASALRDGGELSVAPQLPAPAPAAPGERMQLVQSKPAETVTVHARDFDEVRSRAQRLAARCKGQVMAVAQTKDAVEQTFLVELPREYVAAFKVELTKVPGPSVTGGVDGRSDSADVITSSAGVLTGNGINAPSKLGLGDEATAATTVLEIRVVAPPN